MASSNLAVVIACHFIGTRDFSYKKMTPTTHLPTDYWNLMKKLECYEKQNLNGFCQENYLKMSLQNFATSIEGPMI